MYENIASKFKPLVGIPGNPRQYSCTVCAHQAWCTNPLPTAVHYPPNHQLTPGHLCRSQMVPMSPNQLWSYAVPGGCICIIYFQDSKCDTFSLLANTHDPENRFQKLNKIHRRRLSWWNRHTDSLTFVDISHHCHQTLTMVNNATNDSLVNWIVLWTLTHSVLLVKAMTLLVQLRNGHAWKIYDPR